jgi:hypothetical protein
MTSIQKLSSVVATLCLGVASVQAAGHTYNLNNIASGNWNNQNARTANTYLIGYNAQHPNEQGAYFEYDFTPAMGKTVTGCSLLIAGSTDYSINSYWGNPDNGFTNHIQFKVGSAGMNVAKATVAQITTGNNIANMWHYQCDANQNTDGGYVWVPNGLHTGTYFDAFHYESTGQAPPRIQTAVNAGGDEVIWSNDRYDKDINGNQLAVNYIWGSTGFLASNVCKITTSN